MNKQQQELYEKLLKKVNEYCLGQAAEDVIAAIDALVDTYEKKITVFFGSRANGKTTMLLNTYEEHKALEIIKKKKVNVWTLLETKTYAEYNFKEVVIKPKRKLTQAEYDLLKEILG